MFAVCVQAASAITVTVMSLKLGKANQFACTWCNVCRGLRLPQRKQLEAASTAGSSNTVTNKRNNVTNSEDPEEVEFQVDQLHLALIKGVCGPPPPQVGCMFWHPADCLL
jgi:hypothetical protein